jgi:tRNA(adenine34) deaminase
MKDEDYMRIALEEAKIALKEGNWPIGCVIELNGKIITKAHNKVYTQKSKLAHAEMLALIQGQEKLLANKNSATIYTTYEPCPMCFGGIVLSGIKRVVCGIDLDNSGAMYLRNNLPLLFKQDRYQTDLTMGVLANECAEVFMKSELAKTLNDKGLLRKI